MNDQNKMLKDQRKKLDDEVRRNQRFTVTLQAQATKLKSEIDELILRNSTAEQEMVGFRNARETKMLEHDTLKLEVNKLKTSLSSRCIMSISVLGIKLTPCISDVEYHSFAQSGRSEWSGKSQVSTSEEHAGQYYQL